MKKDLIIKPGSRMSRLFGINRFSDIFDEFDKLWETWDLDMRSFMDLQPKSNFPKINVTENETTYEVEIALAGFDKDDISIELKDNSLFIKANKKEENTEEDKKYLMKEISSRSFRRVLSLPKKVLLDDIKCTHKNGVIECVLTKEQHIEEDDGSIKIDIN
jgi:HSP20 family protein